MPAGFGQFVETRAAASFRHLPLGRDELLKFKALERGIERTCFNQQRLVRGLAYELGYAVTMQFSENQGSENEHAERTLKKFQHVLLCGGLVLVLHALFEDQRGNGFAAGLGDEFEGDVVGAGDGCFHDLTATGVYFEG